MAIVALLGLGIMATGRGDVQGQGQPPQFPHYFAGKVTVGSDTTPAGAIVTAEIAGAVNNPLATNTVDSNSRYEASEPFTVSADNLNTVGVKDGGANGDPVVFKIDGVVATMFINGTQVSSVLFAIGGLTEVDLDIATPGGVRSISVTPAAPSIADGGTQQLTATGTFTDGVT